MVESFMDIERRLMATSPAVAAYRARVSRGSTKNLITRNRERDAFEAANRRKSEFAARMKREGEDRSRSKAISTLPKFEREKQLSKWQAEEMKKVDIKRFGDSNVYEITYKGKTEYAYLTKDKLVYTESLHRAQAHAGFERRILSPEERAELKSQVVKISERERFESKYPSIKDVDTTALYPHRIKTGYETPYDIEGDRLAAVEKPISELIPSLEEVGEAGQRFRKKHPELAEKIYETALIPTTFLHKTVRKIDAPLIERREAKLDILREKYKDIAPSEELRKDQERLIGPSEKTLSFIGGTAVGMYTGWQEKPIKTTAMVGVGLVLPGLIGGVTRLTGAVPYVGTRLAKYGIPVAMTGATLHYGADVISRLDAPVPTGDVERVPISEKEYIQMYHEEYGTVPELDPDLKYTFYKDVPIERIPTEVERGERFGEILGTEILPMGIGAGLTTTKKPTVVTEEITPTQFEIITGLKQTTFQQQSGRISRMKLSTKPEFEMVPGSSIRASEIRKWESIKDKPVRKLELGIKRYTTVEEKGLYDVGTGYVHMVRPLELISKQKTLTGESAQIMPKVFQFEKIELTKMGVPKSYSSIESYTTQFEPIFGIKHRKIYEPGFKAERLKKVDVAPSYELPTAVEVIRAKPVKEKLPDVKPDEFLQSRDVIDVIAGRTTVRVKGKQVTLDEIGISTVRDTARLLKLKDIDVTEIPAVKKLPVKGKRGLFDEEPTPTFKVPKVKKPKTGQKEIETYERKAYDAYAEEPGLVAGTKQDLFPTLRPGAKYEKGIIAEQIIRKIPGVKKTIVSKYKSPFALRLGSLSALALGIKQREELIPAIGFKAVPYIEQVPELIDEVVPRIDDVIISTTDQTTDIITEPTTEVVPVVVPDIIPQPEIIPQPKPGKPIVRIVPPVFISEFAEDGKRKPKKKVKKDKKGYLERLHQIGDPMTALASCAEGFEQFTAQQRPKKNGLSSQFMPNMPGDMFGGLLKAKRKVRSKSKAPKQQFDMLNWL